MGGTLGKIGSTISSFLSPIDPALNAIGASAGKAAIGVSALRGALMSLLIVGGISLIVTIFTKLANATKEAKERVAELYSELYSLKDTRRNIESLVADYQELANTVGKTNEQLEEMKNLQQQIGDAAEGYNFFYANGAFNDKAYEKYLQDTKEEYIEGLEEGEKNLRKAYGSVEEAIAKGTQTEAALATEILTAQMYDSYENYYDALIAKNDEYAKEILTTNQKIAEILSSSYESNLTKAIENANIDSALKESFLKAIETGEFDQELYEQFKKIFGDQFNNFFTL